MGFRLFGYQKGNVPRNATFVLTEIGRSKAENFTGDTRTRILMALDQNGASNTEEIAKLAKVNKGKVEAMIPSLVSGGFIQPVRENISA